MKDIVSIKYKIIFFASYKKLLIFFYIFISFHLFFIYAIPCIHLSAQSDRRQKRLLLPPQPLYLIGRSFLPPRQLAPEMRLSHYIYYGINY